MKFLVTVFILLLYPEFTSAQDVSSNLERITVTINHDDGGKTGKRHLRKLLDSLNNKGCNAISPKMSTAKPVQLIFDSRPASIVKKTMTDYHFIARAKTLEGKLNVRGAILVHASTGINDLSLLQGEWISFVSKKSFTGYLLPLQLLQDAGVNENNSSFYFVGNHGGAVSALLHRDVHVAVMAEPLAKRWAEQNGLAIVAVTDKVETGGWWIHKNVSDNLIQNCTQSLTSLNRSQHKVLPAWIDGFVNAE